VRKNDLPGPQPSSAPVVKEAPVKQKEALRLENANEIRRPEGKENEVEKSTKSSVSFSVSASKSSLSDSSKEMLQAALNNLHKIAGDKKKEKEASQSARPATRTEAKVESEVKDLRAGSPPSRPRFLNPTSATTRPSRLQQPQSSARPQKPQGSGRPSRPKGFGRPSRPQSPSRPPRPESSGRPSTRGQVPPRPQNTETEEDVVATTARVVSVRTKRPRPSFNRGRPPTRPISSGPKSERLEIQSTSSERPERTERPKRPQRPRPVFKPKRPEAKPQSAVLPPIQLKSKDPGANPDEQLANVEPLTEEEKARKTNERNNLLNLLSKNRKNGRPGGRSSNRPQPSTTNQPEPERQTEKKKEMSPLETLFQIITTSSSSSSSTSSSSSFSSSSSSPSSSQKGVRVTSHGRKQGKRKKGSKRPSAPSPTEDPELRGLSPQERLVKKVQETLGTGQEGPSLQARDRPRGVRKKVILRKEKPDRGLPREGRRLGEGSKIKTRKIRVRRPEEEPPLFPIVY